MNSSKIGNINKDFQMDSSVQTDYMPLINQYSRRTLTPEEVYVFPVTLCDNEIDRDMERFNIPTLYSLSEMFVGKTGICDHDRKTNNQVARIFKTSVDPVPGKKTRAGDDLYQLNAMAYIMKTPKNEDLIAEIDGGIKKEVSVGVSIKNSICSICGQDYYASSDCMHHKGQTYEQSDCYVTLDGANDAYEFSFVAVPAQPGAGVTKAYDQSKEEKKLEYNETLKQFNIDEESFKKFTDEAGNQISSETIIKCIDALKQMGEVEKETFISKSQAKEFIGEDLEAEKILELAKSAKSIEEKLGTLNVESIGLANGDEEELKEKSKAYDKLVNEEIEEAIKMGIRAKGDSFNEEKWKKILKQLSYKEILDQKEEWHGEADKELHAGRRFSKPSTFGGNSITIREENYDF